MMATQIKPTQLGVRVATFDQTAGPMVAINQAPNQKPIVDWNKYSPEYILDIGRKEEEALSKTLDVYLAKINKGSNPSLFKLVDKLQESVDQENLMSVADQIINPSPTFLNKIVGMFSQKSLEKAKDDALESIRRVASGKTKNLTNVLADLQKELDKELSLLDKELKEMGAIRQEYFSAINVFEKCVSRATLELDALKSAELEDPNDPTAKHTREDIIQSLESRVGALDGTLTRMPADIEVIRQLIQSGFSTIQEVSTTSSSRFSSIKMTLLTLHTALVNQSVQRLSDKGAALDRNLLAVRSKITSDVCQTSASMAGNNRLEQANQIKMIIDDTKQLVEKVAEARRQNTEKFEQARQSLAQSKTDLLEAFKV